MKDFVHFISDIRTTGAIMPSSRFLVDAAVDQLREHMPPAQLFTLQLGDTSGIGSAKTNRVFDLIQRFAPSTSG